MDGETKRLSHLTIQQIYKLKPEIFNEPFKFITCVRNPYDRLVSEYYYLSGNLMVNVVTLYLVLANNVY